jgi:hypothetical protein
MKYISTNLSTNLLRDTLKRHLSEIIYRDYLSELFREIIWEKSFEKDHLRKSEEEIFDKRRRNRILKQTTRKLKVQSMKLFYLLTFDISVLSIFSIVFSYQIFLFRRSFSNSFSQMSFSNNLFQMIFLKWSL